MTEVGAPLYTPLLLFLLVSTTASFEPTADCAVDLDGLPPANPHTGSAADTGSVNGWRLTSAEHQHLDAGTLCNIERISLTEWRDRYMVGGETIEPAAPVVILMPQGRQAAFHKICARDELLRRFGGKIVTLSSANSHSYDKIKVPFDHYVNTMIDPVGTNAVAKETYYLFGDNDYDDWSNFTEHYERPDWIYSMREPFFSFGLGGCASGVPFHTHGAVFAEVIYGRKRWFATSPNDRPTFSPDNTSLLWVTEVLPTLRDAGEMLDCTLGPGMVLYLPTQWWHATLNLGDTVFMSTFI